MILRFILAVLFVFTLTSCATSPVMVADSRPVSPERLLYDYAAFSVASENTAKVVVVRDAGTLFGAGAKAKFFVDGMPIATVWPGERVEFFSKSGSHILAVAPQPQLMGALTESSFAFETGKQYFFRISISGIDSAFRLQPTTQISSAPLAPPQPVASPPRSMAQPVEQPPITPPSSMSQPAPPQAERQHLSQQERTTQLDVVQLQPCYSASRLFLQPQPEAARLSMVPSGVNLKVIEHRGAWLCIETPDERRGWILREWIQD